MINKKILFVVAGVAAALTVIFVLIDKSEQQTAQNQYLENNLLLKQMLAERGISMSSPVRLQTPEDITKYCTLFTDENMQKEIGYCTSTELKDSAGRFLGNVHMVGLPDEPKIIMALIQTDPFMSEIDSVKTVFDTTIQNLVCNCWEQEKPGNFDDVGQWVDGLRQFHLSDTKPHSKSKQLLLESKTLQLELTTNKDGYLWQLFIYTTSV
jgi:hypothetical protein